MIFGQIQILLIVIAAVALMVLMIRVTTQGHWVDRPPAPPESIQMVDAKRLKSTQLPDRLSEASPIASIKFDPDEFRASPISEQIEGMVKLRLQAYPDLSQVDLDFGTGMDGSLDIWVDGERYQAVEDVPDARIRKAIAEAVNAFNK